MLKDWFKGEMILIIGRGNKLQFFVIGLDDRVWNELVSPCNWLLLIWFSFLKVLEVELEEAWGISVEEGPRFQSEVEIPKLCVKVEEGPDVIFPDNFDVIVID